MFEASCSRKSFLTYGLCTLAAGLVGCSEDPGTEPRATGGAAGSGGGKAGGGAGGSSGGGAGGTSAGGGGTGGSGTSGSAGTAGTGGGGTAGSGGSAGSSGSAGTSGSGGSGGGAADMCTEDVTALCSPSDGAVDGHTHTLVIPLADIMAGVTKSFESSEDVGHTHCVELTAEDFDTLKSGGVVKKPTCNGGNHEFVISCAASPPAPVNPTSCPGGDSDGECG